MSLPTKIPNYFTITNDSTNKNINVASLVVQSSVTTSNLTMTNTIIPFPNGQNLYQINLYTPRTYGGLPSATKTWLCESNDYSPSDGSTDHDFFRLPYGASINGIIAMSNNATSNINVYTGIYSQTAIPISTLMLNSSYLNINSPGGCICGNSSFGGVGITSPFGGAGITMPGVVVNNTTDTVGIYVTNVSPTMAYESIGFILSYLV
jgi:hypothetical protein